MTKDELDAFLEANRVEINGAIKAKLIEGLLTQHRWEMSAIVAETVNEFVKTEVVPEIKSYLEGEKGVIIASAKEAARQIGDLITQQMVTTAANNLSGYNYRGIVEAIFKP
jgi:uncharacterized Fe-S cluster-containing MiaB family protein